MASAPYLIFSLQDSLYAVNALSVCEIIGLPELTSLVESPSHISGVINLRGKIVPVIDLNLRLGYSRQPYQLRNCVIVFEDAGNLIGIIVNEVRRVQEFTEEEIEIVPSALSSGRGEASSRFLNGIFQVDDAIIMLLHLENLLHLPEGRMIAEPELNELTELTTRAERSFCPEATPEERIVFHTRARSLRQPSVNQDSAGLIPLAVVGLNGEYFAFDLGVVREFSALRTMTHVPCCPEHVVGQMNLRGDILTLVDIRTALQMPLPHAPNGMSSDRKGKVVVIQINSMRVGVLVDEVFDVLNLQSAKIRAVPTAVQSLSEEYLQGTAPYKERMLSILDLSKIFTQGTLIVNEEA